MGLQDCTLSVAYLQYMFHDRVWLTEQFRLMNATDSLLNPLRTRGNCLLSKARDVPYSYGLIEGGRCNQVFTRVKACTHNIVVMAS